MHVSQNDERLLYRFLDGELTADEAVACRARLECEPLLRQCLEELRDRASGFATARAEANAAPAGLAPAGFTTGVLAAVRRLPDREALRAAELTPHLVVLCRRLLIAAAIVIGLGLLWQTGLFTGRGADTLQARPGEMEQEMQRLDEIIKSGILESGRLEAAPRGERPKK